MSMSTAADMAARIRRLTSLPAAYLRVKRTLDDPNGSLMELTEALSVDPAMTARLLQVVNSPFYGFSMSVVTVYRAVNVLGMQQVHDLVLAYAISSTFANVKFAVMPMKDFWRKSVATAIAARLLAKGEQFIDAERLFVEGLLADIGHLVMYTCAPEEASKALLDSVESGRPLHEVEEEIIGCHFAEVGAALVSAWDLPAVFKEPIACQLDPAAANNHRPEAAILNVAGALAESLRDPGQVPANEFALNLLKLDAASLAVLRSQVIQELDPVVSLFFPNLKVA